MMIDTRTTKMPSRLSFGRGFTPEAGRSHENRFIATTLQERCTYSRLSASRSGHLNGSREESDQVEG